MRYSTKYDHDTYIIYIYIYIHVCNDTYIYIHTHLHDKHAHLNMICGQNMWPFWRGRSGVAVLVWTFWLWLFWSVAVMTGNPYYFAGGRYLFCGREIIIFRGRDFLQGLIISREGDIIFQPVLSGPTN